MWEQPYRIWVSVPFISNHHLFFVCFYFSCWVSTLPVYLLLITTHPFTLADNTPENLIRVDTFLASVNLSDPKVFYVRNNLDVSH